MRRSKLNPVGRQSSPFSRRSLLKGAAGAGVAAVLATRAAEGRYTLRQSTPTVDISGTQLRLLQWQHFVPAYDDWFPGFLQEWGDEHGVEVEVDMVNTADIPAAFAAEISAGQGHDLVEHIAPLAQYEETLVDLRDVVEEAKNRHGDMIENCEFNSYNPTTDAYFGFCHGYAPDPSNYRRSMWEEIEMPEGPLTYDELIEGGTRIWEEQGIQMGIGMSQEIDSQMAAQAMLWAFGAEIQDENENVTINSPEAVEAVQFMKDLYEACMTDEVFGWNAASNNQLLIAGQASYILNSISAYRTAQIQQPEVAEDIFIGVPLIGPAGEELALAHAHAAMIYHMPSYSENQDTAREFLLHLTENYELAVEASEMYNFPAFASTAPTLTEEGGMLDNDPFGSEPPDKLNPMRDAHEWTKNLGWPGPANAMASEAQTTFILSDMMANAARETMTVEEAVADAEDRLNALASTWRDAGLMGGG